MDDQALTELKTTLPDFSDTYPFDIIRKERLSDDDRLKLRAMTDYYRRCE